jgi:hypothetical protein
MADVAQRMADRGAVEVEQQDTLGPDEHLVVEKLRCRPEQRAGPDLHGGEEDERGAG